MAAGKKLFNIPSIEQMDMEDLRERESVVKCRTAVSSGAPSPMLTATTSTSSDGHWTGHLEKKSVSEPVQKGSSFGECFAKLARTSHHETIQKELENLRPELLVEPSNPPKRGATSGAILVNPRQRGNPLLKGIRNVPWEYSNVVPDYVMGKTTCALFLSLRYHNLNPDYIHERLKQLGRLFDLRVLLVQVDVKDPHHPLKELTKIALMADCTLLLAWSAEEAGRHIETYKVFEMKPPDLLMKKQEPDSCSKILGALTSVKSVNRSDALTLMTVFGTLEGVVHATEEELSFCPGMGQLKAKKLYGVLHEPFIKPTRKSS